MKKNKAIILYTILALLPVIILPFYIFLFLPPKFNAFIVDDTETEAIRVANHLASTILYNTDDLSSSDVIDKLKKNDAQLREKLQLSKLKLFLSSGEVIYSSTPKDIGKVNNKRYFFDVVARGNAFSKWVRKETRSLEGQIVAADVVETYVPIMRKGNFIGAFEIYYDITATRTKLNQLTRKIYIVLIIISGILLGVVLISALKAKKQIEDQKFYQHKLHQLSITDDLTGLLNRRGFMTLAEKQQCIAERCQQILLIAYSDIDGMKWINDNLGHDVGDKALIETAELLKSTFRNSDIISRLGGDEFAVLLSCAPEEVNISSIETRFYDNLIKINAKPGREYSLQVSLGVSRHNDGQTCTLDELMTRADELMYERKQRRKNSSSQQQNPCLENPPWLAIHEV